MEKDRVISRFENFLREEGMNPIEFLQRYARSNASFLNLCDSDYKKFKDIYDQLELIKDDKDNKDDVSNREKGQLLENLTKIIFEGGETSVLLARKNCRTSTNEIDLLLEWSEMARFTGLSAAYPCFGDSFICECKNYDGKVGVTYVGKFYSLLAVTETNLGVMVAWDGVTASNPWRDSSGLIKKIALAKKIYIIPIDKSDLKSIYDNETNIFKIVHDKYLALKEDIDYEKYIKAHEAEAEMCE